MMADWDRSVVNNGSTEYDTLVEVTSDWLAWHSWTFGIVSSLPRFIYCLKEEMLMVNFHARICALFWQLEIANRPTYQHHTSPMTGEIGWSIATLQ